MQMSIRESLLQIPALRSRCPLPGLAEKGILLPKQSLLFSPSFPNRKEGERGQCCSEFSFLLFVYISHPGERKQLLTSVPALFERERKALEKGESVADVGRFPPTQMSCSEESSAWGSAGRLRSHSDTRPPRQRRDVGKRPPTKGLIQTDLRAVNNLITSREMVSAPQPRRGGAWGSQGPQDKGIWPHPQGREQGCPLLAP